MRGAIFSAAVFMAWMPTARATTVIFNDFKDISPLTLSGNAKQVETADGAVLRLTPSVAMQNGSAFGTVMINAAQFYSTFTFRISNPDGTAPDSNGKLGADGFTFAIQNVSASLGSRGGGIGIERVSPSVAIEFDTYKNNDYKDPGSNHIGIDINGVVTSVATVDIPTPFNDGKLWYAWVDCDESTITVSVSQDPIRPETPQLSYPVNVEQIIGSKFAYVGFTAATGGGFQNHDIVSWVYLDHFVSADAGAPDLDGGDLPDGGPPDSSAADGGGGSGSGGGGGGGASGGSGGCGSGGGETDGGGDPLSKRRGGCGCDVGGRSPSLLALVVAGGWMAARRLRRRAL